MPREIVNKITWTSQTNLCKWILKRHFLDTLLMWCISSTNFFYIVSGIRLTADKHAFSLMGLIENKRTYVVEHWIKKIWNVWNYTYIIYNNHYTIDGKQFNSIIMTKNIHSLLYRYNHPWLASYTFYGYR